MHFDFAENFNPVIVNRIKVNSTKKMCQLCGLKNAKVHKLPLETPKEDSSGRETHAREVEKMSCLFKPPQGNLERDERYRGTSLIRIPPLLGPYRRTIPRVLWGSKEGGLFL